jgi:hypothetical protein
MYYTKGTVLGSLPFSVLHRTQALGHRFQLCIQTSDTCLHLCITYQQLKFKMHLVHEQQFRCGLNRTHYLVRSGAALPVTQVFPEYRRTGQYQHELEFHESTFRIQNNCKHTQTCKWFKRFMFLPAFATVANAGKNIYRLHHLHVHHATGCTT